MTRLVTLVVVLLATTPLAAQPPQPTTSAQFDSTEAPPQSTQIEQLRDALVRLPLAAALASILALRPRRRGTPRRQASVIQTQIILAVVGAVVMLVVGQSLARAFGIVGAAGLVRYRAKIADPKDAGVMLSTLAIGLAAGVGIWMLAAFATVFIMVVLWVIESFEKARAAFDLKVEAKDPAALRPRIEELLAKSRLEYSLRTASNDEVVYEVQLPIDKKTDRLSNAILKLDPDNATGVEWKKKEKK
jgi:uncharacterized membrane protein YhiD involved in acid resistance